MDPNTCLEDLCALARILLGSKDPDIKDALTMAEMFLGLDRWIRNDGILPGDWWQGKNQGEAFVLTS